MQGAKEAVARGWVELVERRAAVGTGAVATWVVTPAVATAGAASVKAATEAAREAAVLVVATEVGD